MAAPVLMVLNAGSSSLKFQISRKPKPPTSASSARGSLKASAGRRTSSSGTAPARTSKRWPGLRTRGSVTSGARCISSPGCAHNQAGRELMAIGHGWFTAA